VGAVFSHQEGFTTLKEMVGALAFHAIATGLGAGLLGKMPGAGRPAAG
jgi:hypothetical protein